MPASHPSGPDPAAPAALAHVEVKVARAVVAAHRARLNWLLRVPEWMALFAPGMVALGLPGQRQGVGLEAAVGALALEHKHQLVRWVVGRFDRHLSRDVAQRLCRIVGVERFSEVELDSVLTLRQWGRLRESLLFRLGREHARYKHAQQLLFVAHHALVERLVSRLVFSDRHRGDCLQEARVALLHAIDRADTEGDFCAYAAHWMRRAVRNFMLRQRLPVCTPANLIVDALAGLRARDAAGETVPSGGTDRIERVVVEMLRQPTVSLDQPPAEGEAALPEILPDARGECPALAAERIDLGWVVRCGLEKLTDKQREVLTQRFGLGGLTPTTLAEIARRAGISHQQAGMRERRALERLHRLLTPAVAEYGALAMP